MLGERHSSGFTNVGGGLVARDTRDTRNTRNTLSRESVQDIPLARTQPPLGLSGGAVLRLFALALVVRAAVTSSGFHWIGIGICEELRSVANLGTKESLKWKQAQIGFDSSSLSLKFPGCITAAGYTARNTASSLFFVYEKWGRTIGPLNIAVNKP
ncbi:hypothetical protein BC830DRAFT_939096 [Chytriomyces sp. MP71]|nr:hypothetical protein BC830DRAFT_939096 [Chytriomyces sp. MP71]